MKGLIDNIPVIIQNIPEIIKAIVDTILAFNWLNLGGKIIEFFAQGIKGMLSSIVNVAKDIIKSITDGGGLKNLPQMALQWGKDLISNFVSGIKSTVGKVGDAVFGVADKIASLLHFSEPDEGPLSNFHTYGPDMVELFANGIEKSKGLAASAARDMAQAVSNAAVIPAMQSPAMKSMAIPELSSFSIPAIARGAVVPENPQFSATANRRSDTENIAKQLSAVMQALQRTPESQAINITIETKLDGAVVARNTVRHINNMTIQAGKSVLLI